MVGVETLFVALATLLATVIGTVEGWRRERKEDREKRVDDRMALQVLVHRLVIALGTETLTELMTRVTPESIKFPIRLCELVLFVLYAQRSMAVIPVKRKNPFKFDWIDQWLDERATTKDSADFVGSVVNHPVFAPLRRHLIHLKVDKWTTDLKDWAAFRLMGKRVISPPDWLSNSYPTSLLLSELEYCCPEVAAEVRKKLPDSSSSSQTPIIHIEHFYAVLHEAPAPSNLDATSSAPTANEAAPQTLREYRHSQGR